MPLYTMLRPMTQAFDFAQVKRSQLDNEDHNALKEHVAFVPSVMNHLQGRHSKSVVPPKTV